MKKAVLHLLPFLIVIFEAMSGFAQGNVYSSELPPFALDRIIFYDSVAVDNDLKSFEQLFGTIDPNFKILHITKSLDSLVIFPMYKNDNLSNLLIISGKNKVFTLNRNSSISAKNTKGTPVRPYFKHLFRKINKEHQDVSKSSYWLLMHWWKFNKLKMKQDDSDFSVLPNWQRHIQNIKMSPFDSNREIVRWGQNDGDFDAFIYEQVKGVLFTFIKSKVGEHSTVEFEKSDSTSNDSIPTFYSIDGLKDYLDSNRIIFPKNMVFSSNGYSVGVSKSFLPKIKLVCELKNSHGVTIDDYFDKHLDIVLKDRVEIVNLEFIFDSVFMEEYRSIINMKISNTDINFIQDVNYILENYPACYEALPQIIKLSPK